MQPTLKRIFVLDNEGVAGASFKANEHSVLEVAMNASHHRPGALGSVLGPALGPVLGLTTLLTVVLVAFAWPASQLEPRDLPAGLVGPAPAAAALEQRSDGALDVTPLPSREAAVRAIEDREVYGALVPGPSGTETLVASAASPVVAQQLGTLASEMALETAGEMTGETAGGAGAATPSTTDVVPLPADDPRGAVLAAGSLPLVLGGMATAALLGLNLSDRRERLVGAVGVAAGAGLALTAVLQYWFGALSGDYLTNAGVVALGVSAIALALLGLDQVLGRAGLVLGAATVLLLGNPLSAVTSAPELLPTGWSTVGQLLPPGATGTALRSVAFFGGAGAPVPLLVLTGWAVLGAALLLVPARRAAEPAGRAEDRRTPGSGGLDEPASQPV
jgi:hypothetical protein